MMHYNESTTPLYSRNPSHKPQKTILSEMTSKKSSIPQNQSFQLPKRYQISMSRSRDADSILQNSQHIRKQQRNSTREEGEKQLSKKQRKILKLRKQINQDNNNDQAKTMGQQQQKKSNHKRQYKVYTSSKQEHLYTQPPQQTLFSPKILNRSKSMTRKLDVSTLLYEDAKRRQQKQQFLYESERKQRDMMSPKINNNTNVLVLKKIYQEFNQLATQDQINPLIALSILQELFNVNLNPHKPTDNRTDIQKLLTLLQANSPYGEIHKQRIWNFITLIILGELEPTPFTRDQEKDILQNYQFLYKQRITRQRKGVSPDQPTFRPKTLSSSTKLAHSFRQKTCQKIDDFVQNQKTNLTLNNGSYSIEDLYIIDHHKKMAENQRKRREKEHKQLQECTFKPDISPSKNIAYMNKNKPKIALKTNKAQTLKTQYTCASLNPSDKSTITSSKIYPIRSRYERQQLRKGKQDKQNNMSQNVKDAEKVILRMSVGRQKRQYSNKVMERGYPKDQNWDYLQRSLHRQTIENHKKLKGYNYQ